jgi:hypothetical protein
VNRRFEVPAAGRSARVRNQEDIEELSSRGITMEHPVSESSLERFAAGRTSPAENRSLVAHLLKGCSLCSRKLVALLRPEISQMAYDPVFTRVERSLPDTWSALRHEDLRALLIEAR